ncbi:MAG TPA: hypothetical protein VGS03_11860 [Candidatus Polarisedimenticolia bacterium]|jgi:hypothetical protein|nr:hypothetical protein [Candidatus Polarisedimenticolia bacterium]
MKPSWCRSPIVVSGFFAVLAFLGASQAFAQESAHFSLDGVTVTAGAADAASARFALAVTVAELEPSGAASFCNAGFGVILGAGPFTPELPVPNHLIVLRNAVDPAHVDLSWSGTAASYDVYRSQSASTLTSPANHLTTSTGCLVVDTDPFTGPIVYYTVVPAGN